MPQFQRIHPAFEQLPENADWQQFENWPDCDFLNQLLLHGVSNKAGKVIRFAPQDDSLPWPELYYEQRIAQHGVIATRANWHDFFNSIIWCLYPDTKASISALHSAEFDPASSNRTRLRDALTLFDENGALVVSSNLALLQAIIDFNWQSVFIEFQDDWHAQTQCHIVGHALFEKLLTPYIGITANTRLFHVPNKYFDLPLTDQRQYLDVAVAAMFDRRALQTPRNLSPFPLLGVPGWWDDQSAEFFANTNYFRAKSFERQATILTLSL